MAPAPQSSITSGHCLHCGQFLRCRVEEGKKSGGRDRAEQAVPAEEAPCFLEGALGRMKASLAGRRLLAALTTPQVQAVARTILAAAEAVPDGVQVAAEGTGLGRRATLAFCALLLLLTPSCSCCCCWGGGLSCCHPMAAWRGSCWPRRTSCTSAAGQVWPAATVAGARCRGTAVPTALAACGGWFTP